ncbi:type I polyketide synthase [Streptomyces fradiae]|uniref:type I polyketide synthase n=1 Tax=Streptomyces fradiae TaxID=1906 RepID=UPI002941FECF|nr:SDR family NAD(P)-dependent oxidoreductase [Streptomyces fradiae]WOI61864.1 SDR family NAD(P)-dependent oxidoreductase [Streptomyces fradiae]
MYAEPVRPDRDDDTDGRIAVIGMAGRFPGAGTPDELWSLLVAGEDAVTRFTPEELTAAGVPAAEASAPGYVPAKGVLDDVAGFDSRLFGYSALEASVIDPQQRIFLECAWAALEDAGCDPDRSAGPIAVYAGSLLSTYLVHNLLPRADLRATLGVPLLFQSNQPDQLATRAAYKLNLRGPAVTVQTACSTSLVAVHMAVQSLLGQECDTALAGGVTVTVPHRAGYLPVEGGIESPEGRCRPYSAQADGTVFGNGAGVVVLKRLADALADGDRVHAVLLGSAVNNDGAAKAGYTAPGVAGQTAVIREALSVAGVSPRTIGYVQGHGTGTALGDPIEVEALTRAFRAAEAEEAAYAEDAHAEGAEDAEAAHVETAGAGGAAHAPEAPATGAGPAPAAPEADAPWCALGSVKSAVGHLDTAAGVTGLIAAVQALRHGTIPATLRGDGATAADTLAGTPFHAPAAPADWPRGDTPRRAAVSAFGIGGTNAHVVLEEAPHAPAGAARADGPPALPVALPLSARTATALDTAARRLAAHLEAHPDVPLADVARTLRTGRRRLDHRRVVLARDTAGAAAALRAGGRRDAVAARTDRVDAPVAFLLPGQGTQLPGMALGLYEAHPVFRAALDECAALLRPELGRDLVALLRDGTEEELRRTDLLQPAVVAVGHALARLWEHWGVRPAALLGHSLGEFTAAALSGVFDLPDALRLAAVRGRLMAGTAPGGMLAVPLAADAAAREAAALGLDLAAVNGPGAAVLSGPADAVEQAARALGERGLRALRLPVDRAFHSALCDEAAARFADEVAGAARHAPRVPFVSGVTGDWITAEQAADPGHWARQMRAPVRFDEGLRTLTALDEGLVLVENGPGSVLTDLVRSARPGADAPRTAPAPLPSRGRRGPEDEPASAVLSLAGLWAHGAGVTWEPVGPGARVTGLPGYPFERLHHWIDPGTAAPAGAAAADGPTGTPAEEDLADALHATLVWRPLDADAGPAAGPAAGAAPDTGGTSAGDAEGASAGDAAGQAADPLRGRRQTWLVLMDREGAAQPAVDLLTARGQIVTVVRPGPAYRRVRRGVYELDPADPAQYAKLLADLRALVRTPTAVLYAWGLDSGGGTRDGGGADETACYFGLVRLARAMAEESVVNEVRLGVLTAGAFRTGPDERPDPAAAMLSGPVQVLPEEYANLRCAQIDLAAGAALDEAAARTVLGAVLTAPARLLALRGGTLLTRTVHTAGRPVPAAPVRLADGATWVVTGGFGGIGRTLAADLARTRGARLALLSRTAPETGADPAETAADGTAGTSAGPAGTADGRHEAFLAELRAAGAEAVAFRADVTDAASLAAALDRVRARFGRVDGVVHAAGLPGGGSVALRGDAEARAVFAPKVDGIRNLLAALRPDEADVLVVCSSLATLVPTYGQADYAAANAYLAAAAEAEAAAGTRHAVAVDWDMWAGVGMAADAEVPADLRALQERMLAGALTARQGARAFAALLDGPAGRHVVARPSAVVADGVLRLAGEEPAAARPAAVALPRPDLATPYAPPGTPTEERLAEIYGEMLGVDRVGVHDDFLDLGGHSLLAAQIAARLRAEFDVEVPARAFFEGGRVADLAELIEDRILAELENQ